MEEVPTFQAPYSRWARESKDCFLPFPFPGQMESATARAAHGSPARGGPARDRTACGSPTQVLIGEFDMGPGQG